MKKTTVYILALVLCLSLLCACGDRNDNNKPVTTPIPTDNHAVGPDDGNVDDDDGIITDDDDDDILGGGHDDDDGEDDRDNDGAVDDIIDGDTPDMPEPNVGDDDDANGGAGTASGNVTGNGDASSRRARLR